MVRVLLLVSMFVVGCKDKQAQAPAAKAPQPESHPQPTQLAAAVPRKDGTPVAPGMLHKTTADSTYGVALGSGQDVAKLQQLAKDKGPSFDVEQVALKYLFTEDRLAGATTHMPAEQVAALKASPQVLVIHGSGSDGLKLGRDTAHVAADVADAAHGWVVDPATSSIYSAADFHAHVPGDHLDVHNLIVVRSIMGTGKQAYLITAGMHRYGVPELYVPDVAAGDVERITALVYGAAQALVEGGDVNDKGEIAIGKALVTARWSRDPGTGDEVIELVPATK
jgi:hypothetical protein